VKVNREGDDVYAVLVLVVELLRLAQVLVLVLPPA
jgi:hypothetical protein